MSTSDTSQARQKSFAPKCKQKSVCSVIHIQVTYVYNVLIVHVQNHKSATEPTFSQF